MKKVALASFLILQFLKLTGQTGFNIILSPPYSQCHFYDLIVDEDELVGWGIALDSFGKQGVAIIKMDSLGIVTRSNFILDSIFDPLAINYNWGKIIKTTDGGYAATAATAHRNSAFLFKFDHNCQLVRSIEFPDTVNLSNFFYIPLEVEGGYLLFGTIQRPDYNGDGFLRRVDSLGNTVWFKYVSVNNFDNSLKDANFLNDSTLMVVINTATSSNSQDFESLSSVYLFDLNGNQINKWTSDPNPEIGSLRKVIPCGNNQAILYGQYLDTLVNGGSTGLYQPVLSKINGQLEIEWFKHFGPIRVLSQSNTFHDFTPTIDNNFVGCGAKSVKTGDEPSRGHAWIYKFTPQGDSIWSRVFPTPLPDFYPNGGRLYGVGILSSGSIVAGGRAYDDAGNYYCWVVKLSNAGCLDTLFCQTTPVFETPPQKSAGFRIFPNPAQEQVQIELPPFQSFGILKIVNQTAELVYSKTITPGEKSVMFSLEQAPNGIYFVHYQGPVFSCQKKLVVCR